jgi:hypothetical protein
MKKGDIVGNIVFIYFKGKRSLHISKINITSLYMTKINVARCKLLKVLFLDF